MTNMEILQRVKILKSLDSQIYASGNDDTINDWLELDFPSATEDRELFKIADDYIKYAYVISAFRRLIT